MIIITIIIVNNSYLHLYTIFFYIQELLKNMLFLVEFYLCRKEFYYEQAL